MNEVLLCGILNRNDPLKPLDAVLLALIGIAIVFVVLIVLMLIIMVMGKIFDGSEKLKNKHPEWNANIQSLKKKMMFWKREDKTEQGDTQSSEVPLAKGTCGEVKLINVEDRDAAMIMAIVADEMGAPLNELRFKSIKKMEE